VAPTHRVTLLIVSGRTAVVWIGSAVAALALLVALLSTAYRGEPTVDDNGRPAVGAKAGTGSHNVLALGCLGTAVVVGSTTVVIAKATRKRDPI
jgi:hypothetical protein